MSAPCTKQSHIQHLLLSVNVLGFLFLSLWWNLSISCTEHRIPENDVKRDVEYLPFVRLLGKAPLASGALPPQILLVEGEKTLYDMTARVPGIDKDSLGKIDFSRDLLVCIIIGNRPSTGYSVHVDSVRRSDNDISLLIREVKPGPRQAVEDAETIPFEIIRLERSIIALKEHKQYTVRLIDQKGKELAKAMYSP